MNLRGELSNKSNPIVAINFETIFSKKLSLKDKIFGDSLAKRFNPEYKELTYKLYNAGFNVYITSFNPKFLEYEDILYGNYLFYNDLVLHSNVMALYVDCKFRYSYYIDEVNNVGLFNNAYSLAKFKEVI